MSTHKIPLSERETLHVEKRHWNGRKLIDLRIWATVRGQEPPWPTGKGFAIPPAKLHELEKVLADLRLTENDRDA
jgi:hypothetical protein